MVDFNIQETREHYANRKNGKAWFLPFDVVDPTGADDNFAYFKNDGQPALEVVALVVSSTVIGTVKMELCTGTAVGGTTVAPISLNREKALVPIATYETGVDITGLTDAGIVAVAGVPVALDTRVHPVAAGLGCILGNGDAVLLNWSEATGILKGGIIVIAVPED